MEKGRAHKEARELIDLMGLPEKIDYKAIHLIPVERKRLEIAHRAYLIENGKIVMEGKSQDFIADDYVRESYLGI